MFYLYQVKNNKSIGILPISLFKLLSNSKNESEIEREYLKAVKNGLHPKDLIITEFKFNTTLNIVEPDNINTLSDAIKNRIDNKYKLKEVVVEDLLVDYLYLICTINGVIKYFLLYSIDDEDEEIFATYKPVLYKSLNEIDTVDILLYFNELYQTNFLYRLVA